MILLILDKLLRKFIQIRIDQLNESVDPVAAFAVEKIFPRKLVGTK